MSVDILITSLQSWEMVRFCCLSHPDLSVGFLVTQMVKRLLQWGDPGSICLWSFITAALVAPTQYPRNSSQVGPERLTVPAEMEQATLCAVSCSEKHQCEGQPARGDQWCSCKEVLPRREVWKGKMGLPCWSVVRTLGSYCRECGFDPWLN